MNQADIAYCRHAYFFQALTNALLIDLYAYEIYLGVGYGHIRYGVPIAKTNLEHPGIFPLKNSLQIEWSFIRRVYTKDFPPGFEQ